MELTELVSKEKQQQVRRSTESTPSTQSPSGTRPTALDILLWDKHELHDSADDSDPVLNEIDSYMQDQPLNRETSPLEWWESNEHRFPLVAQVARKYQLHPHLLKGYFRLLD